MRQSLGGRLGLTDVGFRLGHAKTAPRPSPGPAFLRRSRPSLLRPRELARTRRAGRAWPATRPPTIEELPPREFISKEVDPILDKISAQGIRSLTEKERKVLEAARKRIETRQQD